MSVQIRIKLNEKFYLRDPEETELGRKIIRHSILLIDEIGFESFTFKKLAIEIDSTEASVYRYFENKHLLLVYLSSWYWAWIDYRIEVHTHHVAEPERQMEIAIKIISESNLEDVSIPHIDESILHRIVVRDSTKSYCNINVDKENKEGFFANYKTLCKRLADIILRINSEYPYANSLASTLLETAHQQYYFAQHLPRLTNISDNKNTRQELTEFLEHMSFTLIRKK